MLDRHRRGCVLTRESRRRWAQQRRRYASRSRSISARRPARLVRSLASWECKRRACAQSPSSLGSWRRDMVGIHELARRSCLACVDFLGQAAFMLLFVGPCVTTPSHSFLLQAIFRYSFPVSRDTYRYSIFLIRGLPTRPEPPPNPYPCCSSI